jgi:hypothetical protein
MVAIVIFWRQSNEWIALLTALWLVTFGTMAESPQALAADVPLLRLPVQFLSELGWSFLLPLFLLTFPDGRFEPRWMRWFFITILVIGLLGNVTEKYFLTFLPEFLPQLLWFSMMMAGISAQIYRYRKVSSVAQRQQTKWVVSGLVITALGLVGWSALLIPLLPLNNAGLPGLFHKLLEMTLVTLMFLIVALTIGISILRYHLWDIDLIIRRTLIYGALTVSLGLLFAGSVVVLQQVFQAVSGNQGQSQPAIVVSTLAVAALFNPLRKRLQERIDRRFFRMRYDAEQVLAAFAETARRETDLEALTGQLVDAVQSSLQPERVSIWLKGREPTR